MIEEEPLSDDDIATASAEDRFKIAFVALSDAVLDLGEQIIEREGPLDLACRAAAIADMALAASEGRLTQAHIAGLRKVLAADHDG